MNVQVISVTGGGVGMLSGPPSPPVPMIRGVLMSGGHGSMVDFHLATGYPKVPGQRTRLTYYVDEAC